MPPKANKGKEGKGKGKKGKGKRKSGPPPMDRLLCVAIETDLNRELAKLRKKLDPIDKKNIELNAKLAKVEEDHFDISEHLGREIAIADECIENLQNQVDYMINIHEKETNEAAERVKELEAEYKSMHDRLSSEVKLLSLQYSSLSETRILREDTLNALEKQISDRDDFYKECQAEIKALEQKAWVELDSLKKDVEPRIGEYTKDLKGLSAIRNASYIRGIFIQNMDMRNNLNDKIKLQMKFLIKYDKLDKEYTEAAWTIELLEAANDMLIHNSRNKIGVMEDIEKHANHLRRKFVGALNCIKLTIERDQWNGFDGVPKSEIKMKHRHLAKQLNEVKTETKQMRTRFKNLKYEAKRIRKAAYTLKRAIYCFIGLLSDKPSDTDADALQEFSVLHKWTRYELVDIIAQIIAGDSIPAVSALTPSLLKIVPKEGPICERGFTGLVPKQKPVPKKKPAPKIKSRKVRKYPRVVSFKACMVKETGHDALTPSASSSPSVPNTSEESVESIFVPPQFPEAVMTTTSFHFAYRNKFCPRERLLSRYKSSSESIVEEESKVDGPSSSRATPPMTGSYRYAYNKGSNDNDFYDVDEVFDIDFTK